MSRRAALWLACTVFVVYGSLVPLDFQPLPLERALQQFAAIPFLQLGAESRADWIANGVLYFPLGALAALTLAGGLPRLRPLALLLAWVLCATLAVGVEFLQLFFPPRTVSMNDVLAEGIGAAVGVLLAGSLGAFAAWLMQALRSRAAHAHRGLGLLWLAALVLLALFPYDLVLSADEWRERLGSGNLAWWWVSDERGLLLALLRWGAEVAVVVPLGLCWAWRRPVPLARAALAGLALGLLIELGQLLLVSGVSQGASVLSRAAGVVLGACWLRPLLAVGGPEALRVALLRWLPWLLLPYLAALLLANGWFRSPWRDAAQTAGTWQELRLLPFYYHYYTSEAIALVSLLSVVLMYLPLAAWAWARRNSPALAALVVGLLALAVEASKLFLGGMRPDPTNILIAACAVGGVLVALRWFERSRPPVPAPGAAAPARQGAAEVSGPASAPLPAWAGLVVLAGAVAAAATLPGAGWLAAALVAAAAAAVAWRPWLAAAVVPAALPMLDFATITGRVWVDEFDLLVLACAAVVAARVRVPSAAAGLGRLNVPLALMAVGLAVGVLAALVPLPRGDTGGLADPMNALSALFIGKGLLLVWLTVAMLRLLAPLGPRRDQALCWGMVIGLAWTVAVVLWERLAFVALFDFESIYRVTGPFSAMHRGGAYLEAYLVLATAFLLALLLRSPPWPQRLAAAALLVMTAYAVMVTYSRNGYVAWVVVLLLGPWLLLPRRGPGAGPAARWLRAGAVTGLALMVMLPIALTGFARDRIERSLQDLQVRQAHWADAIALRPDSAPRQLFGAGLGRFPELHYWGSREAVRAATIHLRRDGDRRFLQLGPGAPTYVEQWVQPPATGPLTLQMDLRPAQAQPGPVALSVTLCEKWMLTSARCETAQVQATGAAGGAADGAAERAWRRGEASLASFAAAPGRPLKLTVVAPTAGGAVDLGRVSLRSPDGTELLANGDFSRGLARWFWTTDVDPPWHIHSLPVSVWFELGWVGVLLWSLALALAAVAALRRWQQGQRLAPVALVALAGFLTSGLVNTLVDTPRFLFLLLLLVWLCGQDDAVPEAARN